MVWCIRYDNPNAAWTWQAAMNSERFGCQRARSQNEFRVQCNKSKDETDEGLTAHRRRGRLRRYDNGLVHDRLGYNGFQQRPDQHQVYCSRFEPEAAHRAEVQGATA